MRFSIRLTLSLFTHILKNRIVGNGRFPLVLMLEPTHLCNLRCEGCGRIREYSANQKDSMPLEDCLAAVEVTGAPVVSICGGEPLLYPQIGELVQEALKRGRHIILCTNGMNLEDNLPKFRPHPYFNLSVSLDGLARFHDSSRGRQGVYELAIKAIKSAKEEGFKVITNTTIYKETDVREIEALFEDLDALNVDGLLVTPAYPYQPGGEGIFLDRKEIHKKFEYIIMLSGRYRFLSTPPYLRFLKGDLDLRCTPWGNVTINPQGWKGPCYFITEAHYKSFGELMEQTDWEKYEARKDPRCQNCMVHSGFEPTVIRELGDSWSSLWEMIKWNFS